MSSSGSKKVIACVGAGYVGGPTSAVLALQVPDIEFHVLDKSASRIKAWKSDRLPISEPGLLDVVRRIRRRPQPNLFFSTDIDTLIPTADIIFIAVETPSQSKDDGANGAGIAPDLRNFRAAVHQIGALVQKNTIIVNKSTLPCGAAEMTAQLLQSQLRNGVRCQVLSNPEFLAEGTAVQNLLQPDRVVIGSSSSHEGRAAAAALGDIYARWVPRDRIVTMSTRSSELSKLAANMFLSQRISSINALSVICDKTGEDITEVARACGLDPRIGPHMIRASVGFGGSCFKKDVLHLVRTAEDLALDEVASYFGNIVSLNTYQTERYAKSLLEHRSNGQGLKIVAILGFAFKPNTGDTRESPAISFIRYLLLNGVSMRVFDPLVEESGILDAVRASLQGLAFITDSLLAVCKDVYAACDGANAVAILNPWEALQYYGKQGNTEKDDSDRVQWDEIARSMNAPRVLFDGHNFINPKVASIGFQLQGVGRRSPVRSVDARQEASPGFAPRALL
ncbi:nucleotide sugar dehydrogenase [Colletotrichum orchidophilum]|uniref:UDP-glucose 6-dehydrogenase n=1 Tax=Colletotrichum orchidophilum TaxID=1209926 RepID=A0A1G4B945_9PEZI|nr:nucleotide sugar dehydrogenase [Colletotrichum orchidophilum]OHE97883.1 nucleotide sugar dehydrogenase [Colletotrichum orchidophilum]